MKHQIQLWLAIACGWCLASCAEKGGEPQPSGGKLPAQTPQGYFDPGPGGTPAEHEKARLEAAAKANQRGVKLEEFTLVLLMDAGAAAGADAVNIDVISATAAEAARLERIGPVKYRDARQKGPNTRSLTFRQGGRHEVAVPTIPAADTVLLWAELPAPQGGGDTRLLAVPLALDRSDPDKGPQAHPITVRLTANGWLRES